MCFSDMVQGGNGLLVELRCKSFFNEQIYYLVEVGFGVKKLRCVWKMLRLKYKI